MSTSTDHTGHAAHARDAMTDVTIFDDRPAADADRDPPSQRRRWPYVAVAAVAVAAGASAVIASNGGDDGDTSAEPPPLQIATAGTADLVEFTDLDGTLTHASTSTATATADGLVTKVAAVGDTLAQGDVAYGIDGRPVVVMYGDVPLYRELADGAEGDDVLLLEQNLAALGFHVAEIDEDGNPVDEAFVVDGVFDDATAEAVERWQDELGVEPAGVVLPADVLMLPGPSEVTDVAVEVGDRTTPSGPVLTLNRLAVTTAGPATTTGGEIEVFVTTGQTVESGDLVHALDDEPFTAIVTDTELTRDIEGGIDPGDDVRAIEEMLVELGYDADGALVVDDMFDDATESAIEKWEADLSNTFERVDVDGTIDLDEVVLLEPGTSVGDMAIGADDAVVASGTLLWTSTVETSERIVTTAIPVADQDRVPVGSDVTVELLDGEEVTGVVSSVATTSTVDPTVPDADPELAVEIVLATVPESIEGFTELDVVVKLVDEMASGVTVVPASALVATGDGGYAVEVVDGATTRFVAVEPGMFSDGQVEVDGITSGTDVVVAS